MAIFHDPSWITLMFHDLFKFFYDLMMSVGMDAETLVFFVERLFASTHRLFSAHLLSGKAFYDFRFFNGKPGMDAMKIEALSKFQRTTQQALIDARLLGGALSQSGSAGLRTPVKQRQRNKNGSSSGAKTRAPPTPQVSRKRKQSENRQQGGGAQRQQQQKAPGSIGPVPKGMAKKLELVKSLGFSGIGGYVGKFNQERRDKKLGSACSWKALDVECNDARCRHCAGL